MGSPSAQGSPSLCQLCWPPEAGLALPTLPTAGAALVARACSFSKTGGVKGTGEDTWLRRSFLRCPQRAGVETGFRGLALRLQQAMKPR